MKIIITNDDGIFAPGIIPLVEWAKTKGEVTVVAPKTEQSGKSHGINFTTPIEIQEVDVFPGVRAFSMDSTPADCVRFGIMGLKEDYDLVLSGINRGVNMGVDIVYSGTVAAAFEAAYWDHRAIAISTYPDNLEYASAQLDRIYSFFEGGSLFDKALIYNVNIPNSAEGIRITRQGSPYFNDGFEHLSDNLYIQTGDRVPDLFPDDLSRDVVAVEAGYISVTPITLNRVDENAYKELIYLNGAQ